MLDAKVITLTEGNKNGKPWRIANVLAAMDKGADVLKIFLSEKDPIVRVNDSIKMIPRFWNDDKGNLRVSFRVELAK